MEAFREIYECSPAFVSVPPALRNRRAEIIFLALNDEQVVSAINEGDALPDYEVLRFAGSLPDFPERGSQSNADEHKFLGILKSSEYKF
jgi:hypothetical protein